MTPIVFSTDDNYIMPTAVAIKSILDNTNLKVVEFYILFKDSLSDQSKLILKNVTQCDGKVVAIKYLDVAPFIGKVESHIGHISRATYYRLTIPELLRRYDQCLYLDGDIIVTGDIKALLKISLPDKYLIAGVRGTGPIFYRAKDKEKVLKELGIPDLNQYVNAGVLLMNLKKMRKEGLVDKMIQMIPKEYSVQDQDIINIVCYDKILFLSPKFNAMPVLFEYSETILNKVYSMNDIREAKKVPCIIHFANKYKPWEYSDMPKGDIWYETYRKIFPDSLSRTVLSRAEKLRQWIDRIKKTILSRG